MSAQTATHLLVIDPQNDFCDIPPAALPPASTMGGESIRPALPVPGGHQDMMRLAALIDRAGARFREIHVTLDSHHPLHIAHPRWWIGDDGDSPAPFTSILAAHVRTGKWRARNPAWQERSQNYVDALESGGRYTLVVWPEHCLIGHWGHNVHPAVARELDRWGREQLKAVDYTFKGSNPFTEHYSAVRADVVDPMDTATQLNKGLIDALDSADTVVVAGEALSHCVANTIRDVSRSFGPEKTARLVLLTDCTSSVAGFEDFGTQFLRELTARGMKTARSVDLFN